MIGGGQPGLVAVLGGLAWYRTWRARPFILQGAACQEQKTENPSVSTKKSSLLGLLMNALYGHTRYRMAMVLWDYQIKRLALCTVELAKMSMASQRKMKLPFILVITATWGAAIIAISIGVRTVKI